MKPVRIFRHLACEGPGYLATWLERQGVPLELVRVDAGAPVPATLDEISGLVFMGGPMSVNDPLPWVAEELRLIQRAAERRLPVLGHCLGGQLIARALGGTVAPGPRREIGWHPVRRTDSAEALEWLGEMPEQFEVFHWHGETFTIPPGASRLLESKWYPNQAFVHDGVLALQCHVEMTVHMVEEWAREYAREIAEPSESVQSAEAMTRDLDSRVQSLNAVADVLYARWIANLA
ncbi:MAG: type 1 glutamine amidotransferase [Pseudomonadota bacterium]|nr:MAG: type 1 glutamine amidotransferase [Pseudomonadota bacterium]